VTNANTLFSDGTDAWATGTARQGHTLLELIVVLTMMAVFAAVAAGGFGPRQLGVLGAKADARRLARDLNRARRFAISSGDNHLLAFQENRGRVVGYTLSRRRASGVMSPVDEYHEFPSNVNVGVSPNRDPEFNLEGAALAASTITLSGPSRAWTVTLIRATGAVRVAER